MRSQKYQQSLKILQEKKSFYLHFFASVMREKEGVDTTEPTPNQAGIGYKSIFLDLFYLYSQPQTSIRSSN